jgi:hypothetical protein
MTILITSHFPEDARRHQMTFPEGWDVMAAVLRASETCTWARGWCDMERGAIWPFNPDMPVTVDGKTRRACEIAAERWGGNWADALERERLGISFQETL